MVGEGGERGVVCRLGGGRGGVGEAEGQREEGGAGAGCGRDFC